jgi:NADH:ubiquinone oxidoreductase subunit C
MKFLPSLKIFNFNNLDLIFFVYLARFLPAYIRAIFVSSQHYHLELRSSIFLIKILKFLKLSSLFRFKILVELTGVTYNIYYSFLNEKSDKKIADLHCFYMLFSMFLNRRIVISCPLTLTQNSQFLSTNNLNIDSVTHLYPSAN